MYKYDQIGNLTQNLEDGIADIEWNIYGKVEKVSKTNGTLIAYRYDSRGNRILKEVRTTTTVHTNFYLRDASGNVMAIYEDTRLINSPTTNIILKEIPIYGSSRLGQYRPKTDTKKTALGQRIYEFSNHLGNVLVTLTDNKVPQTDGTYSSVVVSASDYYPFGMAMSERTYSNSEYRYGFNGKENDTDFGSHIQDLGARFYSGALGRMFSVDPIGTTMPDLSVYHFADNCPIWKIDLNGLKGFQANLARILRPPSRTQTLPPLSVYNPNIPSDSYQMMVTLGMLPQIPEATPQIELSNQLLSIEGVKAIAMSYYGHSEGSWAFVLFLHGKDINEEISKHNETVLANRASANSPETKKLEEIQRNMYLVALSKAKIGRFAELHSDRFILSENSNEWLEYQNLLNGMLSEHPDILKGMGFDFSTKELIFPAVGSYENARNFALKLVGELGATEPYFGRLEASISFGKITGRISKDKKVRWRIDWDQEKGLHINVEDYREGKGNEAKKYVIPIAGGTEEQYKQILDTLNPKK